MAKKDAGYASPPCFMHELEESGAAVSMADERPGDGSLWEHFGFCS